LDISYTGFTSGISRLFRDRNFIFILSVVLGLAIGQGADFIEPILVPVMAVNMTLSTISITNHDLASIRRNPRPLLISLLLSYAVQGGIMLLLARWLINDGELWAGFVTLAAIPPAVSTTVISYILGGDLVLPLIGTTGSYLVALALTPAIMLSLLGFSYLNPARLLLILVQLIVIPLIVSRVFIATGVAENITKWRDTALNWVFAIACYIIIGVNRQVFFQQLDILLITVIIAAATSFGIGHAIDFVAKRLHLDQPARISWVVMGTKKNTGLASAVALAFLGPKAAFPAAIVTVFDILTIVWWGFYFKKEAKQGKKEQEFSLRKAK
jgi:BASS family bile acid:Na+ symporter